MAASSCSARPLRRKVASVHSTMKVDLRLAVRPALSFWCSGRRGRGTLPCSFFLEVEREGRKRKGRAQPDEAIRPGLAGCGGMTARAHHLAVYAVAANDQVGRQRAHRAATLELALKLHIDLVLATAALQDVEQRLARKSRETRAGRPQHLTAVVDSDVVPVGEAVDDLVVLSRHRRCAAPAASIGKHHPKAEGVVGAIALQHRDLVLRIFFL